MIIKKDCELYSGSRPCPPNKLHGASCQSCRFYARKRSCGLLVIKLGASGDVLRTTALLPELRKKAGPQADICWLTSAPCLPLLEGNPFLDETLNSDDPKTLENLLFLKWQAVYCLDNSAEAASFCAVSKADKKYGFSLSRSGEIDALDSNAARWLELACFDQLKKKNKLSYQEIMRSVCGLRGKIERPILASRAAELARALQRLERCGAKKIIGVNTGSGSRWPKKMLAPKDTAKLCKELLASDENCAVALLGGPLERSAHRHITSAVKNKRLLDTGNDNSLAQFAALVACCDVLVCGDTLALHTATAVGTPAVALFGPTSANEIYGYDGLVLKLTARLNCLCCYGDCSKKRHCMNSLPLATILQAVKKQLAFKRNGR